MGLRINIEKVNAMIDRRNARGLIKVLLKSDESSLRCLAAAGLGDIGNRRASGYLIKTLEDRDIELRRASAGALGKLKDYRAVKPLINALKDEDTDVRFFAIGSLGDINDPIAVRPLTEVMENESEDDALRLKARKMLGNIGSPAVGPLIKCLQSKDYVTRWYAAVALGEIGDRLAEEPVINLMKDEIKEVRRGAAGALGNIGGPGAVDSLIECVRNDRCWIARKLAVEALGRIRDKRAIEPITEALKDKIYDVKKAARQALKNING